MNAAAIPSNDVTPTRSDYRLLSFAPSSGVGFYLVGDFIYQFDLVSGTDLICEGSDCAAIFLVQDQLDAEATFPDIDRLKAFARLEYLRDKKNTYYALILTENVTPNFLERILQFLNEDELTGIPLSEKAIPILQEIASPATLGKILNQEQGFTNVLRCFSAELPDLVFDAVEPIVKEIMSEPQGAASRIGGLTYLIALARSVPERVDRSLIELITFAEGRWFEIGSQGMRAISALSRALSYDSPRLAMSLALTSESSLEMRTRYKESVLGGPKGALPEYRRVPPDLAVLGRMALRLERGWTGEWDWPFPWRLPLPLPLLRESLRLAFAYRGYTFDGNMQGRFSFTLQVADRPDSMQREIARLEESSGGLILAARTAFWAAFLLDPETTISRLITEPSPRFNSARDVIMMTISCYDRWGRTERPPDERGIEPASLWSVCYPDILNFAALPEIGGRGFPIRESGPEELRRMIHEISRGVMGKNIGRALGLPDAMTLLFNNLLCLRLSEGSVAAVQAITSEMGSINAITGGRENIEITGILRFIL